MLKSFGYTAVDAIQSAKKELVTRFVCDERLQSTLLNFVDGQSKYTKDAIDVGVDTFTSMLLLSTSGKYLKTFFPLYK